MGQAKQRGTFEQRRQMAIERDNPKELTGSISIPRQTTQRRSSYPRQPSPLLVMLAVAAITDIRPNR